MCPLHPSVWRQIIPTVGRGVGVCLPEGCSFLGPVFPCGGWGGDFLAMSVREDREAGSAVCLSGRGEEERHMAGIQCILLNEGRKRREGDDPRSQRNP